MRIVRSAEFTKFGWDENKRLKNIEKSGIDFFDAADALMTPHLEIESPRDGEQRTKAICMSSERIIVVVFTVRDETCRVISSWPADKNEQRAYRQLLSG